MNRLIDEDIIRNDFLTGIASKYSIPYEDLLLELDKISKTRIVRSKYSCDHNFFSNDNELSFYWAGFIAADGCIYKKGESKTLNIALSEKDKDHLLKFKEHVNFDGKIYTSISKHSQTNPEWNDSIKNSLQISSPQIFEDLKRFNVVPNKTKTYTFPEWLTNHKLVNHFMRGYVDGDGSFFYDSKRNRVCFELRGNYDFLKVYKSVLEIGAKIYSKVNVTTPDSTSKIKYSSKKLMPAIVDFLYKDATIYLDRKRQIAERSKL